MAQEYAKRFVTKDGNTRISIYREECPCDPRDNTDFPLHCEDWCRDYSIMNKHEREYKASDARTCIERLAGEFGDYKKIIDFLVENGKHMTDGKSVCNNALVYDKSLHGWVLREYTKWYGEKEYNWKDASFFDGKKYDIDLYTLLDVVLDGTIDYIAEHCMTDEVKIASYSFGYNGEISFSDEVDCEADGIAWLEKDEIIKYCGHTEEFWRENKFTDIDWVHEEIEAWAENEVYGFVVENRIEYKLHKEYTNVEREAEDSVEEEWEEKDSCWGYYGELDDEHIGYILEGAGFKREELEEVD